MTARFAHNITPAYTELRLLGPDGAIDCGAWAITAPAELMPGIDLARRLVAADSALEDGAVLYVEHAAVAALSTREAALLGLPPFADVMADLSTRGVMTRPDYDIRLTWKRLNGQAVVGPERIGAWLRVGAAWQRLPYELFRVADLSDRLNAVLGDQTAGRMTLLDELRHILPAAETQGRATSSGLIGHMTIAVADAFSLDLTDGGGQARLVPILHRAGAEDAGAEDEAPLLPPEQQRAFGDTEFNRFAEARALYALGGHTFVVLTPPLRAALNEVRRVQSAPLATKRAFLAAPRAFLRNALGEEADSALIDRLVRETPAYAERVLGLGLWQARVVPWIKLEGNDWIGSGQTAGAGRRKGLLVGPEILPLTPAQAAALRSDIEAAMARGEQVVLHKGDGRAVPVPATAETLAALAALEDAQPKSGDGAPSVESAAPEVLLIADNENEVGAEAEWAPRAGLDQRLPAALRTPLKAHQQEGLSWLQKAWSQGQPGVLLADDMGLGKTLQALALFAWLREGMAGDRIARAPLMIVAPTGLLANWRQEHDTHLAAPGLGKLIMAYGRDLASCRFIDEQGRPRIDVAALRAADCVLTTYETLRDYDIDFGQVRFAAIAFDEAQKIKTPGIHLTDAAKAMNAEFHIALTGTPVENRLADLWCIVDTVYPAFLGDLKSFSSRYEAAGDPEPLRALKGRLDRPRGGRAPLLLRRLRREQLLDLPPCSEAVTEEPMPPPQHEAYVAAIGLAHASGAGAMLKALHALRRCSLHPAPDAAVEDAAFIGASARLIVAFRALDGIAARRERALIFLDDRDMQARLAGLIQRRYRLPSPPMIINGAVPGPRRQGLVNRFQANDRAFDAMILSPRAGGVGLTLTSANHVLHLDRWWNPAVEDQCTGRVLRIGQVRPVTVHIPQAVCEGRRSFDQNLHALLERKRELFRETLMPTEISEGEALTLVEQSAAGA